MGGKEGRVLRNDYKGLMDNAKGGVESGEGGRDGWWGSEEGKCRQLYLNNNKTIKRKNKNYHNCFPAKHILLCNNILCISISQKLGRLS